MPRPSEPPIVLVKWYDLTKWLLARLESFPKSPRFVFGQRFAGPHPGRARDPRRGLVHPGRPPQKGTPGPRQPGAGGSALALASRPGAQPDYTAPSCVCWNRSSRGASSRTATPAARGAATTPPCAAPPASPAALTTRSAAPFNAADAWSVGRRCWLPFVWYWI